MSNFPISQARMVAFFAENIIYGLYLVTLGYTIGALFSTGTRWRHIRELNYGMVVVTFIMFVNTTVGLVTGFLVIWQGFLVPLEAGGGLASFTDISDWRPVLKSSVLLYQTMVGDAMLIYRCWALNNRSFRRIAFSFGMWCGGTVCAVFLIYYMATLHSHELVSSEKLHPFGVAFWVLTVALNILFTALLIWPIWQVIKENEEFGYQSRTSHRPNLLRNVMRVIVESGLLYTTMAFMTCVAYTSNSNVLYFFASSEVGVA
ncbi:hypothetical protein BDQ12DRAFT_660139, partial [Crucibulum laeve]